MPRITLNPHVCVAPAPYRMVEKGIRNSAYHPSESCEVRTVQLASQLTFTPPRAPACARFCPLAKTPPPSPSRMICSSCSTPDGVVPKRNPFCRSW